MTEIDAFPAEDREFKILQERAIQGPLDDCDRGSASRLASVASLVLFLALTVLDIIVVECYYRAYRQWDAIWVWHHVFFILWFSLPLLLCIRLWSVLPASVIVAFVFGMEDTMFYLLQMRIPIPVYRGVDILGIWEPTLQVGLAANCLGLVMILIVSRIDAYLAVLRTSTPVSK